ncbi:MAG: DUF11 domain-containing protein [Ruminococcaceae bacterium]|nr:DUF11 domain-containing protein [Oscillospiraceae bacterium]
MATFTNRATLTYNNESVNSNTVVGEILRVVSVTKTAVGDSYTPGDTVVYAVSLRNTGTAPLTGLLLTDDLGAYTFGTQTLYPLTFIEGSVLYYVNGALQASPAAIGGPPLIISGISVPAGGNAIIIYEARANEFAPSAVDSVITNTVTVSGTGVGENISAVETVEVQNRARLTITKDISPATVTDNGQLTYTLTIENTGNTPAADTVVITDTFDPILSNISVTYNGTVWTEPEDYTYNEATGEFATVPGAITVPGATYVQDITTGAWTTTPGVSIIRITGTV